MDQNNNFQPQQPQQPQQPYYQQPQMPPQKKSGSPLGIISLIIGIVSVIFCWAGCSCATCAMRNLSSPTPGAAFSWILTAIAAVGIVLAIVAMKSGKNGLAVAGLVLCIIGLVLCLISSACTSCTCAEYNRGLSALNDLANGLNDAFGGYGF